MRAGDFFGAFYERYLASSDEVAAFFAGMDMQRQARMLRASLYLIMGASSNEPVALKHLNYLAERHRHIPPRLYELWLDSLIGTVTDYDPQFGAKVEAAWREMLRPGISYLVSKSEALGKTPQSTIRKTPY